MPAPTPGLVGGRDIALVWDEMPWSLATARYRGSVTISWSPRPDNPNIRFRDTYVDQDVVVGQRYTYQVVAASTASARMAPPIVPNKASASKRVNTMLRGVPAVPGMFLLVISLLITATAAHSAPVRHTTR